MKSYMKSLWDRAWIRMAKKGDVMGIPIQYLLIFLAILIVLIIIIMSTSKKQGGLLNSMFGRMSGMG